MLGQVVCTTHSSFIHLSIMYSYQKQNILHNMKDRVYRLVVYPLHKSQEGKFLSKDCYISGNLVYKYCNGKYSFMCMFYKDINNVHNNLLLCFLSGWLPQSIPWQTRMDIFPHIFLQISSWFLCRTSIHNGQYNGDNEVSRIDNFHPMLDRLIRGMIKHT